jgi:hypothetical protein
LRKRAITTLSNAIIMQIPGFISISSGDGRGAATASSIAMTSFGIPLTGSMSAGSFLDLLKANTKRKDRSNTFLYQ